MFSEGRFAYDRAGAVIWGVLTVLFTRFLYVGLPVGYWPGFYDFSNWLVVLIRY